MQANPLTAIVAAVHDAYLQQREARAARRLRACHARMPDKPRPRQARAICPPEATHRTPAAVSPAPVLPRSAPPKAAPTPPGYGPGSALPFANVKRKTRKPSAADFGINPPTQADVARWVRQLADEGRPVYRNDDGEVSSPELTARYVAQIMRLGRYKT